MRADERIEDYDLRKTQAFRRAYPNRDPAFDSKYVKAFRKNLDGDYGEFLIKKDAMRLDYTRTYELLEQFQEKRILAKKHRDRVGASARGGEVDQAPPSVCRSWLRTGACADKRNCEWGHPRKFKKTVSDEEVKKDSNPKKDKKDSKKTEEKSQEDSAREYYYSAEELKAVPCMHKNCPGNKDDHCARDCSGWGVCKFCGDEEDPHWHASAKKCPKNKFHKKGKFVAAITVEKDGDDSKK